MPQIRYAFRSLSRQPALVLVAVLSIAVGIGANAVAFGLIRAVLLRPLPYRDPARIVQIWQTHPTLGNLQVTWPDYLDWRQARSFESVEACTFQAMNKVTLLGDGPPEQLQATMVSLGLLPMLGVGFARGGNPVWEKQTEILISEALWRRKFASDPKIVGRTIRVPPLELTVAGVVSERTAFPVWADLWLPISMLEPGLRETRRFHPLEVIGRLKPGISVDAAQAEMTSIAGANASTHVVTNKAMGAFVVPMHEQVTGPVRPLLLILWMAAALILLMASANVAHLLLSRTISRSRELAIRVSLGASWTDLARLLGMESLILVVTGAVLGAAGAAVLLPIVRDIAGSRIPRLEEMRIDAAVFTYLLSAAGLAAVGVAVPGLLQVLRRGGSALSRYGRAGSVLLVSEIALAFVVLGSGLLLLGSFNSLLNVEKGFDGSNVLAISTSLPAGPNGWDASTELFVNRLAPAIRTLPGVEEVASANMAPMSLDSTETMRFATRFGVGGVQYREGSYPVAQLRWVSAGYFGALGIALLRGRPLTQADRGAPVCSINQTLAREFFQGQDPVGRELVMGVGTPQPTTYKIAGVVRDVRDLDAAAPPRPTLYEIDTSPGLTLLVRVKHDPRSVAPAIQEVVHRFAPESPATRVQTVDGLVAASLARPRFALEMMTVFAGIAAALAMIGLHGVVSYSVRRRTVEFAIRSAVGARPSHLLLQVLAEGVRIAVAGIGTGLLLFAAVSRLFRSMVFEVAPINATVLSGTVGLILLLTIVALAVPARHASQVTPSQALRES